MADNLRATADGADVVAMAGVLSLRMLADRSGLTSGLSRVLAKAGFHPVHDRGRVLTDVACWIAAGGADISDIEALRAQAQVWGPVASDTTALRALGEIGNRDLYRIDAVRGAGAHVGSAAGRSAGVEVRRWTRQRRHDRVAGRWHDQRGTLGETAGGGHVQRVVRVSSAGLLDRQHPGAGRVAVAAG
jgi:hypothetical protein